jgi:hypothetical protein
MILLFSILLSGATLLATMMLCSNLIFGQPKKKILPPPIEVSPKNHSLPSEVPLKKTIGEFGITLNCLEDNTFLGIYTVHLHAPLSLSLLYSLRRLILSELYMPLKLNTEDFRFRTVGDQLNQLLKEYATIEINSNLTCYSHEIVMEFMPDVACTRIIIDVQETHRTNLTTFDLENSLIYSELDPLFRTLFFLE